MLLHSSFLRNAICISYGHNGHNHYIIVSSLQSRPSDIPAQGQGSWGPDKLPL